MLLCVPIDFEDMAMAAWPRESGEVLARHVANRVTCAGEGLMARGGGARAHV